MPLKQNILLEIQRPYQARKEVNNVPSPLGEGQTVMPINYLTQGEVHIHQWIHFLFSGSLDKKVIITPPETFTFSLYEITQTPRY